MQDDDFSCSRARCAASSASRSIRPIPANLTSDRQQLKQRQLNASVRNDEIRVDGLLDQFVIDVGPDEIPPGPPPASRKASCASSSRAWCPSTVASTCTA